MWLLNMIKEKIMNKPRTFEEAVDYVCQKIDKNTVNDPYFHFSGGMQLRNELGLWNKDSSLYKDMQEKFGLCHADDTSNLIAKAAHARLNNEEYDIQEDVQRYKDHWISFNYDPATMEPLQ